MRNLLMAMLVVFSAGCATIHSNSSLEQSDGLDYFLPKKDFVLSITVKDGRPTVVSALEGSSYPDGTASFNLSVSRGIFGKNFVDVRVIDGLLQSTIGEYTSNTTEIFKEFGSAAGTFRTAVAPPTPPARVQNECLDGENKYIVPARSGTFSKCLVKFTISNLTSIKNVSSSLIADATPMKAVVYYRDSQSYLIRAETVVPNEPTQAFAFNLKSPSESPTRVLRIPGSFFADNKIAFDFKDGVPTKYSQTTDSEIYGAVKIIPAFAGEFFAAIGRTFDAFKANDTKEAASLQAELKLRIAEKKFDACIQALRAGDQAQFEALDCRSE